MKLRKKLFTECFDHRLEFSVDSPPPPPPPLPSDRTQRASLSSENEGPCDDVGKPIKSSLDGKLSSSSSRLEEMIKSYGQESVNEDGESIMQIDDASGKSSKLLQMSTCTDACNEENFAVTGSDGAGVSSTKQMLDATSNRQNSNESIVDDDDDAICRRTRARHSLANYTLEELETFLQESDDDDDHLHNVDAEDEYHKFLAGVLFGGDGNEQAGQGERIFDEDEENDADFEVELEEALESDVEEITGCSTEHSGKQYGEAHVPETRQKKRLKEFAKSKKYPLGQSKVTLRPILPYMSNSQRPPFPTFGRQMSSPGHFSHCSASEPGTDLINGFTTRQVGRLYCLIHEHVQLLLQVFSICVLDPSRQQVANDLRKLIAEMIERHEISLAWKKTPYPQLCFQTSNLYSSVQVDSNQGASCYWTPVIDNNSVLSILDVAPLRLAKNYLADIKETVSMHRQSCLERGSVKVHSIKEPLFPLPMLSSVDNEGSNFLGGSMTTPSSSCQLQSGQQKPKKSWAATILESTMKQSFALVPADIARLARRFLHLFNATLFPHKPPTSAVAKHVHFTDAEDGLLAMGIMEHNKDWLAIKEHFLPCKPWEQIFIRQKNCSSSTAPENPIKAVKRMKSSPLTEDEKALIYEGKRIFHDWLSICKYFVPHRDPKMLRRQWEIATGTQKSYKKSEAAKKKRRLYEAERKRLKAYMNEKKNSEKEVNYEDNSEVDMDCEDEAYIHEAFLADLEPRSSENMIHNGRLSCMNNSNTKAFRLMQYRGNGNGVNCAAITNDFGERQRETGTENVHLNFSKSPKDAHCLHQFSQIGYGASHNISSRHLSSCFISGTSGGHLLTQSYRARKRKKCKIVKLASYLPPVNLPPSVRVISQSAFKIYRGEPPHSNVNDNALKGRSLRVAQVSKGVSVMNLIENTRKLSDNHPSNSHLEGSNLTNHTKENASESNVQWHPLLFHNQSHFSNNCQNNGPSSYNFLLGSQCSIGTVSAADPDNSRRGLGLPSISSTIDFHPLLQRSENNCDVAITVSSFDGLSADLRAAHDTGVHLVNDAPSEFQCDGMNKLDLNIHLSSTMDMQRTVEVCDSQNVELHASTSEERLVKKVVQANLKPFDLRDKELEALRETNLSVQSTSVYSKDGFVQRHDISGHQCIEDFHEESNPRMVMEQEELSDSEDESENVVFECEELEDSEDESENVVFECEELEDTEDESENVVFECEVLEDSEEELCGEPPTQIYYKILGENKEKKDAEFNERLKHRPPKALDEDETEFLEKLEMSRKVYEQQIADDDANQLRSFQEAVASQASIVHKLKEIPTIPKTEESGQAVKRSHNTRPGNFIISVKPQAKKAKTVATTSGFDKFQDPSIPSKGSAEKLPLDNLPGSTPGGLVSYSDESDDD